MSVTVYIGIGSNIGDKRANCLKAIELLAEIGSVIRSSSLYYTEPVGYKEQEDFINAAAAVETDRSPAEVLTICRSIEDRLGRKRLVRWGPRTVDLDILLYGEQIVNKAELIIPHPLMATRKFVLVPLAEIAPEALHPVLKKNIAQLLTELKDSSTVVKSRTASKLS